VTGQRMHSLGTNGERKWMCTRVLHGTSYAIPCPPVPASNSPAPLPLPPVWVPLPSRTCTFVSWSRPGPADGVNAITPWLIKFYDTHCWQVSAQWGGGCLLWVTQACLVAVWDKWQSGNNGGTIDTSVCSLSIPHVARTRRWGGRSRDKP